MVNKVLVVSNDEEVFDIFKVPDVDDNYKFKLLRKSSNGLNQVKSYNPNVIVMDLVMTEVDGLTLLKKIREDETLNSIRVIILSSKIYEFDHKRSLELGADEYLKKPVTYEILKDTIKKVIKDEMKITFWGARGTHPTPGKEASKYGGNTPCVSVEMMKERLYIFDAGTGVISLGNYLLSQNRRYKINLFITHPHWDHIHGFPFFKPVYSQGNEMVVHGTAHGDISLREVVSGQMESIYFPVKLKEFAARVYFKELLEGTYDIEGASIRTLSLNHPGLTLGYVLTNTNQKSVAYITDNELMPEKLGTFYKETRKKLVEFVKNVDVLIHDTSCFDEEYESRIGWGHPPLSEVLSLAKDAEVKRLCLFHHHPDHTDEQIDEKEKIGIKYFKDSKLDIDCFCASEGNSIIL